MEKVVTSNIYEECIWVKVYVELLVPMNGMLREEIYRSVRNAIFDML